MIPQIRVLPWIVPLGLCVQLARALEPGDVPVDASRDAVMAAPAEVAEMAAWATRTFTGKGAVESPREGANKAPSLLTPAGVPFSFVYGGKPSAELLKDWTRTAETRELPDRICHCVAWTDPHSGLRVAAEVVAYKRYAAVDWVLHFENTGKQDTPILEDIQAVDVPLATAAVQRPGVLHHLAGDDCSPRSFLPLESPLPAGGKIRLAPVGGRSSNGTFPFFNFEYEKRGLLVAVGWTGQWAASLERAAAGPTRLRAGMERTHLLLHAGETIRSPRILLMAWQDDRTAAHNRFRRLVLFHYTPKEGPRPLAVPVFWQCYDRYHGHATWPTEAGQLHAANMAHRMGCDFLWLDAAWFPGEFPNGVGNWFCKPQAFPRGLKPVSDACHKAGMKFVVWFEPERVAAGTQIAREHPEFVFGGAQGGLFRLDDPAARRWLTDLLVRRIEEYGMDWYRNDFNLDPLPFWRGNDPADRQGMTEIRYVEGHYAMWDELRARRPGLFIDNCASGGRRIDLETISRSIALWRSDTACGPGRGDWHQAQALGMSYYLPLHQICAWTPDAYEVRSASGAGGIVQFDFLGRDFSPEAARNAVAELRENQKYFYGDFYPLTRASTEPEGFLAYQVHRPDLGAGLVLAFRRAACKTPEITVMPGGLRPDAQYEIDFVDEARQKTTKQMPGRLLAAGLSLAIPQPRSSLLVRYRQVGPARSK
jgi:alpha-galactosidase